MLTRKMQIQAIANALAPDVEVPEKTLRKVKSFEPLLRQVMEAVLSVDRGERSEVMMKVLDGKTEQGEILAEIIRAKPGKNGNGHYQSLAEVGPNLPPVVWLWPKWIPLGMLSLMGAAPGVGKSFMCLDICKRVIHGERWPDGCDNATSGQKHNAIYVDAENTPSIIHNRAVTMGLDQSHLYLMEPDENDIVLDFSVGKNQEYLINMAAALQPRIIVVDSISTIMPRGENNIEDVRMTLSFLNSVAREFETSILMVHHMRKHSQQMTFLDMTIDDLRGSGHIVAMARSVLGVSVVQTQSVEVKNAPRKVQVLKTNISDYPDPLGYAIKSVDENGGAALFWDLEAPKAYKEPTLLDETVEWLEDFLKITMEGRAVKPKEVVIAAENDGISRASIFRARKELRAHIKNTDGRKSPSNCWQWSDEIVSTQENDEDDE